MEAESIAPSVSPTVTAGAKNRRLLVPLGVMNKICFHSLTFHHNEQLSIVQLQLLFSDQTLDLHGQHEHVFGPLPMFHEQMILEVDRPGCEVH